MQSKQPKRYTVGFGTAMGEPGEVRGLQTVVLATDYEALEAIAKEVADRLQRMADQSTSSLLSHNLMEMNKQLEAALAPSSQAEMK